MSIDSLRYAKLIDIDPELVGGVPETSKEVVASLLQPQARGQRKLTVAETILQKAGISAEDWTEHCIYHDAEGLPVVRLQTLVRCAGVVCYLSNEVDFNRWSRPIRERLTIGRYDPGGGSE
ncbi:hypothetical protein KC973_02390 [Candidatus Saccharibacteria bacterium]|nr:hypothetical protein [Candidatus Saccharibacteria bacterium]